MNNFSKKKTFFSFDGDDDEPDSDFLAKKLSDFNQIQNGCIMTIEDFLQDVEIEVTLLNKTSDHDFEGNYEILSKSDMDKAAKKDTLVPKSQNGSQNII